MEAATGGSKKCPELSLWVGFLPCDMRRGGGSGDFQQLLWIAHCTLTCCLYVELLSPIDGTSLSFIAGFLEAGTASV